MNTHKKNSFRVDPRIGEIPGESYRSSEQALEELVDNAWDADATKIQIELPDPMTADPIIITDNGSGMTAPELEGEYLHIGRNRRTLRGERTKKLNRLVKGLKGIDKYGGKMMKWRSLSGTFLSFLIHPSTFLSFLAVIKQDLRA